MGDQRHSQLEARPPRPSLSAEQEARQAAANGFRQFDRLREMIREGIAAYDRGKFRLKPSMFSELARLAVDGMVDGPGHFRRGPVTIKGAKHTPPPSDDVLPLVEDLCEYVNSNFNRTAWHLSAYVMWRLNWIHPFEDGNGRTSRAVSYLVLCVRLKIDLPGTPTVPDLIASEKDPYYQALEAADKASGGDLNVSEMEEYLRSLVIRQIDGAAGGQPEKSGNQSGPTANKDRPTTVDQDSRAHVPSRMEAKPSSRLNTSQLKGKVHAAIITVRPDEYEAMEDCFANTSSVEGGNNNYEHAVVNPLSGPPLSVVLTRLVTQGNTPAQAVAANIIHELDPAWLILVGIAGGVPDAEFNLGDIIIATYLNDFSLSAVIEGKGQNYQTSGGPMHQEVGKFLQTKIVGKNQKKLIELASFDTPSFQNHPAVALKNADGESNLYGDDSSRAKVKNYIERYFRDGKRSGSPRIWCGPCANGNLLLKDTQLLQTWQESARQIVNVETELAGVYEAARSAGRQNYPVLAIRGLSDIVGFKRDPEWTGYACKSAAAVTHAILKSGFIDFHARLAPTT